MQGPHEYLKKTDRIFVAGHAGMVGSAIVRRLRATGFTNIVTQARDDLDLKNQEDTFRFFEEHSIDLVIVAAAKVGGIRANQQKPAAFLYDNLMIAANVIDAAYISGIKRLIFLGSSCIYPRGALQPILEQDLLSAPLEPTNEGYAIAKIAGLKLCETYTAQYGVDYRSLMPTNLYGPGDNFDPVTSHVLPALIRKFHEAAEVDAQTVTLWGSGNPRREFMHVDDLAAACIHVAGIPPMVYDMALPAGVRHVNVGTGSDVSIHGLALRIADVTGYHGQIEFDDSMPDGTPGKLLDVGRLANLGWRARIGLQDGIESTYRWYEQHAEKLERVLV